MFRVCQLNTFQLGKHVVLVLFVIVSPWLALGTVVLQAHGSRDRLLQGCVSRPKLDI